MLAVLEIRRRMYWTIALFFTEKIPYELAEAFVSGRLIFPKVDPINYPDLARGFDELKAFTSGKADARALHQELLSSYQKLFATDNDCEIKLCESDWVRDKTPESGLLEIESIYRVAGFEPEGDDALLFKDNVAIELDFMCYLCKRSIEDRDNLKLYVEKEISFLREHLLNWVPDLCDELIERSDSAYFSAVAKITKGYLRMDLKIAESILSGEIL
ncbi:MAG: TorD/DmsD family molecular chaperone [Candidatus Syntropharchaeales archaeon]